MISLPFFLNEDSTKEKAQREQVEHILAMGMISFILFIAVIILITGILFEESRLLKFSLSGILLIISVVLLLRKNIAKWMAATIGG